MSLVQGDPLVAHTAAAEGILENLQKCTVKLEKINNGVSVYLEKKRLCFARYLSFLKLID